MSTNGEPAAAAHGDTAPGDDVSQVPDSSAPPHNSEHPELNGTTEKQGAPHRHNTLDVKNKIKDQKERVKTKAKPAGGFDSTPIPDAPPGYTGSQLSIFLSF
jgi:hypothetical protein